MIETGEVVIERVVARPGALEVANGSDLSRRTVEATGFPVRRIAPTGTSLFDFALPCAVEAAADFDIRAVVAATFSCENRFPPLSVRIASALKLPKSIPAFDVQMACSAYPYAVYTASRLASDLGGRVLVVDADIQSRLVDDSDQGTSLVMDDAATASVISVKNGGESARNSKFSFFSSYGEALVCPTEGPIRMDGFKVFAFVATEVTKMLKEFGGDFDLFVPHRANLYMVRQLAKSIGALDRLLAPEGGFANPGSASIPLTLAAAGRPGRALIAGFGAGLSAAAATITIPPSFTGTLVP